MGATAKKKIENAGSGVIYARYSSHNQRDVSIEQQIDKCAAYAEANGIKIIQIYSDRAITGKTDNRPNFQKMMRDAKKGTFDYVIAWKSNRMGRNMLQAMVNASKLAEEGVKCLYVEEDFDDTAAGRFALRNMMNVNQFYSENMAEDITRGLMDNASKCMVNGRISYGYRKGKDGRFEIDEPAAAVVREIFERVLSGWALADISADLNRRGIKTRDGNEWGRSSYNRLLQNEQYTGVYKYSGVRVEGGIPAIISKEQFEEVQRILVTKDRPRGRKRECADYLLSGKLFCGKCKAPMVGTCGTSHSGHKVYYYTCKSRKYAHTCDKENVKREEIEARIVDLIREKLLDDELIDFIVDGYAALLESHRRESPVTAMQAELEDVKAGISNIMKAIEAGIITESTKERLLELEDQRKELTASIKFEQAMSTDLTPDQVRFWLEDLRNGDFEDMEYQRFLIKTFVQVIYLYDDHFRIVFNYGGNEEKVPLTEIEAAGSDGAEGSTNRCQAPPCHDESRSC